MKQRFFLPRFTKACCILTGDDFYLLQEINDAKSNKKIQLLAMLMLLPMVLWAGSTFLIMRGIFQTDVKANLLGAFAMAIMVGIIERSIIMSAGNRWTRAIRYAMALVLAVVGSFFIDEIIFDKDIQQKVEDNQRVRIESLFQQAEAHYEQNIVQKKRDELARAEADWQSRVKEVVEEAGGQASGVKGSVPATKVKEQLSREAKQHYDDLQIELRELSGVKKAAALEAKKAEIIRLEEGKVQGGLMYKIGAMFELIFSSVYMFIFWVFFTVLFFLVEILPVSIKSGESLTFYERLVEFRSRSVRLPDVKKD